MPEQLNLLPSDWPPEEVFLLLIALQLEWERYELHEMASRRKIYRFGVSYRNPGKAEELRPIPKDLEFIIERGAKALKVSSKEI